MLSIVIPSFNEELNIQYIYTEILNVLPDQQDIELIFVDDGSKDRTFVEIGRLAAEDKRVRGLRLSRNFGQEAATLAGLREASGDYIVMMDADGQHPPSMILEMQKKFEEGFDVVNTIRLDTKGKSIFRKLSTKLFGWIFTFLSDSKINHFLVDFRACNRAALDAYLQFREKNRFNRGLFSWIGFNQTSLEFVAPERNAGNSNYSFKNLKNLAFDALTSFSTKPLRLSFNLGLLIIFLGIGYAIYAVINYFLGNTNPGWTSLLITILILGGVQLFSLGIIGEYIGKMFLESKDRPDYFIAEKV